MDEATSGQDRSRKISLREIHRKYFNDPNLKHLVNLITSSKLSHEASPKDRRYHLRLITEAFEDLNGLKSIEPILRVASTSQKLQIVFDFNRDSVEFLDPVKNRNVIGTSYTEKCIIYVVAKDLEDKEKRCEVLGVLIHELTHFVMKLVYENESKPYHRGDQEKFNEFSRIVNETAEIVVDKEESEPCIKSVYDYPESRHHAELIVRVPQLTALFMYDEDKTMEVQDEFSKLFDFYDENTLVDLKREFPLMEVKNEIRQLNELFGTLEILEKSDIKMSSHAMDDLDLNSLSNDKFLFISSNCPQLTLSAILQQTRTETNFETSFIFVDLNSIKNDKTLKALEFFTKPRLIIDCQGAVKFDEVKGMVKKLNESKIGQKVIFVIDKKFKDSCDAEPFEVVHSWNHLSADFQQKLLGKKIKFHGTEMVIGELLNDLSSIESIPFQDMLDDKTIVIEKIFEFETGKLVERKFLPPNSKIIDDLKNKAENYTIEHDLDELLAVTKEHKTILISDEPGMGKSTSLKMLHSKLRQKNPTLWIVFMDLKDHFKAYQDSCLEVRKLEDIAKFFTDKILIVESFEAEIFTQLFNEDRVVLLMDGLDEICPSYKQFILSLMKDIQKFSKNQFWISTRPHLVEELKNELNPIEFTLKPFTEANRREFFEKYFNGEPNCEHKVKEIESFLEKLKPYYGPDRSICNPLVMKMIVEILDEDRGLNLSKANYFVIYEYFTIKMIKKCQDRGQEAINDMTNLFGNLNVVEFFQQQAFKICFGDRSNALMREKLIDPQFDHIEMPPLDEIVRIGLMFASSSKELHFIHRTFAEFYVAKFFYEVIFKFTNLRAEKHLNATIEFLFKNVFEKYDCNFIRILLENAFDSDKRLAVNNFPPSTLEVAQNKMELKHFEFLVRSGCHNLIKLIVLQLYPNRNLLFTKLLNKQNLLMLAVEYQSVNFIERFFTLLKDLNANKFKNMFFEQDEHGRNALFFAASNPYSEVFKFIIEFSKYLIKDDELNSLLIQTGKLDKNVLHSAVKDDRNVDIIIDVLSKNLSSAQQKALLEELTNRDRYNLLQYAAERKNSVANFRSLLAFLKEVLNPNEVKDFLLHQNSNGFKTLDFALTNKNEFVFSIIIIFYYEVFGEDKIREIVLNSENLSQESSLYFQRICSRSNAYFDGAFKRFLFFIMKLFAVDRIQKEFFLIRNAKGEAFLEFAIKRLGEEDFAFLCSLLDTTDRAEILQLKNSRGECAFHSAAKFDNFDIFHKFRKLYEESFNKETFRQMIVSCDKSWILDVIEMYNYQNSGTFAELCHCLSDLFKGTNETERLKDFFSFADGTGQTAFMSAARCKKSREFENLFALTRELYGIETVKEFLLLEDENGASAFTYSFMKSLDTTFEFVKSVFEELFEREKMQQIVLVKVRNENILTLSILLSSRLGSFEIFCNYLIKLFENESHKLKNTFISIDFCAENILMKAAVRPDENFFKVLVNVIEKLFVEEEVVGMLCQRNQDGKTAFHLSIENKEEDIFETVKNFYLKTLGNEKMKKIISAEVDWTKVLTIPNLGSGVKRLVSVLNILFEEFEEHLKHILLKQYDGRTIQKAIKSHWKYSNASINSYLEEQFQFDEQIKMIIIDLDSFVN